MKKAMRQVARGLNHYITFLAKVDDHDTTKTFELLVLMGIPKKKGDDAIEVIFYREKGVKKGINVFHLFLYVFIQLYIKIQSVLCLFLLI